MAVPRAIRNVNSGGSAVFALAAVHPLRGDAGLAPGAAHSHDGIELWMFAARGPDESLDARPAGRVASNGEHRRVNGRCDADRYCAASRARILRHPPTAGYLLARICAAVLPYEVEPSIRVAARNNVGRSGLD